MLNLQHIYQKPFKRKITQNPLQTFQTPQSQLANQKSLEKTAQDIISKFGEKKSILQICQMLVDCRGNVSTVEDLLREQREDDDEEIQIAINQNSGERKKVKLIGFKGTKLQSETDSMVSEVNAQQNQNIQQNNQIPPQQINSSVSQFAQDVAQVIVKATHVNQIGEMVQKCMNLQVQQSQVQIEKLQSQNEILKKAYVKQDLRCEKQKSEIQTFQKKITTLEQNISQRDCRIYELEKILRQGIQQYTFEDSNSFNSNNRPPIC